MYHLQCCCPFSYVCGKPVTCRVWPPQRHRWCDTVAEMPRLLHTISCQMLAKLKQNHPRKVHLYFHGLQKILIRSTCSFHWHCLYSILALCILISFFFSFHCVMASHGREAGGCEHGGGGGGGHGWKIDDKPKQKLQPKPGYKPRKGHILIEWEMSNMQKALDEFKREMQVHFISFAFLLTLSSFFLATSSASFIFFWFSGHVSKCMVNNFLWGFADCWPFSICMRSWNPTLHTTSSSSPSKLNCTSLLTTFLVFLLSRTKQNQIYFVGEQF